MSESVAAQKLSILQKDAEELSSLLAQAKREGVKGVMTANLRKLESQIEDQKEKVAAEKAEAHSNSNGNGKSGGEGEKAPKTAYDVQIKNFCK